MTRKNALEVAEQFVRTVLTKDLKQGHVSAAKVKEAAKKVAKAIPQEVTEKQKTPA